MSDSGLRSAPRATPHATKMGAPGIPVLQTRVPGTQREPELCRMCLCGSQPAFFPSAARCKLGGCQLHKLRAPKLPQSSVPLCQTQKEPARPGKSPWGRWPFPKA